MKKVVFLLFLLFLVPSVFATISIDSQLKDKYNVGDLIQLKGTIVESTSVDGTLNIISICGNNSVIAGARYFRLEENVAREFSQDILATEGSCHLYLYFLTANATIDSMDSSFYLVSNELIGNFELNNEDFQSGENLVVKGTITRLDNSNVDGIATIGIVKNSIPYIISSANILNSQLIYSTDLLNLPAGNYNVKMDARDVRGNVFSFDAGSFNFYTDIAIIPQLSKMSYLPGESIAINGSVEKRNGGIINDELIVTFENQSYRTSVINNIFKINLNLAKNIKSYYHDINFYIKDAYDNIGGKVIKIDVMPVPTILNILTDKNEYLPGENIIIIPILLDQAGDLLKNEVNVKFEDENKNIVSNESYSYLIPQFKYGDIEIMGDGLGIKNSIKVNVKENELLDVKLVGQNLLIRNIGNVKWNKETNFSVGNDVISKGINLDVNESMELDLVRYGQGIQDVQFLNNSFKVNIVDDRNILEKVLDSGKEITGATIYKGENILFSKDILYIIGGMLLLSIVFMTFSKISKHFNKKEDEKAKKFIAERLPIMDIKTKRYREEPRKSKYSFGKATEADIEDFKKIYFKKVMPEEDQRKYYSYDKPKERKVSYEAKDNSIERSYGQEKPAEKKAEPGLFSMFD